MIKSYNNAPDPPTEIHKKYCEILSKSKFISNPNEWYIENSEAKILEGRSVWFEYENENTLFNDNTATFEGWTERLCEDGVNKRFDEESCLLEEFKIIYKGIDISKMTLKNLIWAETIHNMSAKKSEENLDE
jgi:hypothetical protein